MSLTLQILFIKKDFRVTASCTNFYYYWDNAPLHRWNEMVIISRIFSLKLKTWRINCTSMISLLPLMNDDK